MDPEKEEYLFKLLDSLAEKAPLYRMECTKNSSAAVVASQAMHGENAVTLRPFEEADARTVIEMLMDEQVKKTYMVPDFPSPEAAMPLFQRFVALSREKGRLMRAVSVDGEAVGMIHDVEISGGEVEVGYVIHPRYWGRGYATRALQLAMEEFFRRGFEKVKAAAFEENAASFRVMEKAGMAKTAQTEILSYRGRDRHCIYYEK